MIEGQIPSRVTQYLHTLKNQKSFARIEMNVLSKRKFFIENEYEIFPSIFWP